MPSLSIWNHLKNDLFLTIWVMFWNISRIYFFIFSIQNIKCNCYIIFLKFFSNHLLIPSANFFPVIFIYKSFNLCCSLWIFFLFLYNLTRLLRRIKAFAVFFIDRIYCCLFIFYPVKRICIWSTTTGTYFMAFLIQ